MIDTELPTLQRQLLYQVADVDRRVEQSRDDMLLPEIGALVGRYTIQRAPLHIDRHKNTDAILPHRRIAVRLRAYDYLRYVGEITLRASVPSGRRTELGKILDGEGDVMFYGFKSPDESGLVAWTIIDLRLFAAWHADYVQRSGTEPGRLRFNRGEQSSFRVFALDTLPDNCIIARRKYGYPDPVPIIAQVCGALRSIVKVQ